MLHQLLLARILSFRLHRLEHLMSGNMQMSPKGETSNITRLVIKLKELAILFIEYLSTVLAAPKKKKEDSVWIGRAHNI